MKVTMNDGSVSVTFHWQHPDHQPFDIEDIASLRPFSKLKEWNEKHVNDCMDWMIIKSLFRMNENNTNEIISAPGSGFPASLLISYHDVQNIIYSHMTKLSTKHSIDKISVDCSPTEIAAIREVLESVDIVLCHQHIKCAWELNIKKHVKITGSTAETKRIQDDVRLSMSKMMVSTIEGFDQAVEHFQDNFKDYQIFLS